MNISLARKFKNNLFIRNCWVLSQCIISFLKGNREFGQCESSVVHTGNHARVLGYYITSIDESNKPEGYDYDVLIEEDVWIGSNVTILAGVTIGRGVTVAAGTIVTKSMPPYCICAGVPARFIKFYWTIDEILQHESKLYPENQRYTRDYLQDIFDKYVKY